MKSSTKSQSNTFDIYHEITSQIIELLQHHQKLEYTQTWFPASGEILANNPVTGNTYTGINQLLLSWQQMKREYRLNRWITFNNGSRVGGKVKKGERSSIVTYVNRIYIDPETGRNITKKILSMKKKGLLVSDEDYKTIPFLRYYRVFNVEQFEDLPKDFFHVEKPKIGFTEEEKDETAENILHESGAAIKYRYQDGNWYNFVEDIIYLCEREQFKGREPFYKTAFHELGHWTGHANRLNRDMKNGFGSKAYAFEELVAELFSAFVSGHCGFTSQITNNAAYIQSWLQCLEKDTKFVVRAAAKAQQAMDYIMKKVGANSVAA